MNFTSGFKNSDFYSVVEERTKRSEGVAVAKVLQLLGDVACEGDKEKRRKSVNE